MAGSSVLCDPFIAEDRLYFRFFPDFSKCNLALLSFSGRACLEMRPSRKTRAMPMAMLLDARRESECCSRETDGVHLELSVPRSYGAATPRRGPRVDTAADDS